MISSRLFVFLSPMVILISQATAQQDFLYHFCLDNGGNYTTNSTYEANLNRVLSSISSNILVENGFYPDSKGQDPDKVYAIGLCRGDVKPEICRSCLSNSSNLLTLLCPNQKEAIGWYDYCMLRFSYRSIFGIMEESPAFYMWNVNNVSDVDGYGKALLTLFDSMKSEAASGVSRKFATTVSVAPDMSTLYMLVQCTPDLSKQNCSDCLTRIFADMPICCVGKQGGREYTPSCSFRFESYKFFDSTYALSPPPPPVSASSLPAPPIYPIRGTINNHYICHGSQ